MTSAPTPPDRERTRILVEAAQAGDRRAFDLLIQRNEIRLSRLVKARLGKELRSHEESADVIQSTLGEAMRALPAFEYRGEGSFLRWLGTLVENKVRHHLRDLHRQKRNPDAARPLACGELAARDPSPSALAATRELEERYHESLDRLAPEDKELLLLHLEIGCSHDEIAQALGIVSGEAVRKRTARALARLQRVMGLEGSR